MNLAPRLRSALVLTLLSGCLAPTERTDPMKKPTVEYLNPEGMYRNPAYSQVVTITGPHRLILIGGQNAVDAEGQIIGVGDLAAQTEQVLVNLEKALAAGGAGIEDVVKWTILLVQRDGVVDDHAAAQAFGVAMGRLGKLDHPPAITVVHVAGLAHPAFLVEIEALAAVGE